jgi:5S rRNA maturation endonuclease (ribonuclease M5)
LTLEEKRESGMSFNPQIVLGYLRPKLHGLVVKGRQVTARCPFHNDHRPSLSINAEKGLFYCHSCRAKGNLAEFERRISGCDKKVAKKRIARLLNRGGGSDFRPKIVATYSYKDENGKLKYQQVRFDPKDFRLRQPDGEDGWIWNLQGVSKILYRLREVLKADQVFVVEGEKDVETLRKWGFVATCNVGGAGKWTDEYSKALAGKKVVILQDDDEPGRKHARAVAQSVAKFASKVILVPPFRGAKDVTEWIENGGTKKKLKKLVGQTEPFEPAVPVSDTAGEEIDVPPDDWRLQPVRGTWVVALTESVFDDYLILPRGVAFIAALWTIGTRIFRQFDCYPYLTVTSPTKRCGKTRFAEILELLCSHPLLSVNVTEAVLFRSIEGDNPPTFIIDEAEALRNRHADRSQYLLSILHAGFKEGAHVLRCVGREHEVKKFSVYCPKVVLAIGNLPDTLVDRSLVVSMRRHLNTERVARFRRRLAAQQVSGVVSAIVRWAEKNAGRVAESYQRQNLKFLRDREADIWEPLFAIASVAVPDRLKELKETALRLSGEKASLDVDDSLSLRLLSDIRKIFRIAEKKAISTAQLIDKLRGWPDSQWGEDLTAISLSKMLRPFGISSKQLWVDESNNRGYELEDFKPVFERYLPPETH